MKTLLYIIPGSNILLLIIILLIVAQTPAFCYNDHSNKDTTYSNRKKDTKTFTIHEQLQVFYPLHNSFEYTITVCADLPVNDNPACVYKKGEPGHVFLILSKQDPVTADIITRSFGFYPRVPVSCIVKQVRSEIHNNSGRAYDASLEKKITNKEFAAVLQKAEALANKRYNLKKYNCYDYVLEVFNSLPGIEKLPVTKVKFPFILGRGGSPCGLYNDLKKLLATGSSWAAFIRFGVFKSPSDTPADLLVTH